MIEFQLYGFDLRVNLPPDPHGVSAETLEVVNPLVVGVEHHVQLAPSTGRADVVELRLGWVETDMGVGGHKCELIPARLAGGCGIHGSSSYRLGMGYSGSKSSHTQCRPHCKSESGCRHPAQQGHDLLAHPWLQSFVKGR